MRTDHRREKFKQSHIDKKIGKASGKKVESNSLIISEKNEKFWPRYNVVGPRGGSTRSKKMRTLGLSREEQLKEWRKVGSHVNP